MAKPTKKPAPRQEVKSPTPTVRTSQKGQSGHGYGHGISLKSAREMKKANEALSLHLHKREFQKAMAGVAQEN
jgi:hypothetical protein